MLVSVSTYQMLTITPITPQKETVLTTQTTCCCKGRACECVQLESGGCQTTTLNSTTETPVAVSIKGAACESEEKGIANRTSKELYYRVKIQRCSYHPITTKRQHPKTWLEQHILSDPLEKPPQLTIVRLDV